MYVALLLLLSCTAVQSVHSSVACVETSCVHVNYLDYSAAASNVTRSMDRSTLPLSILFPENVVLGWCWCCTRRVSDGRTQSSPSSLSLLPHPLSLPIL